MQGSWRRRKTGADRRKQGQQTTVGQRGRLSSLQDAAATTPQPHWLLLPRGVLKERSDSSWTRLDKALSRDLGLS